MEIDDVCIESLNYSFYYYRSGTVNLAVLLFAIQLPFAFQRSKLRNAAIRFSIGGWLMNNSEVAGLDAIPNACNELFN